MRSSSICRFRRITWASRGALCSGFGALPAEQLDVSDHLDIGHACQVDRPVRLRVRQRRAGRQHQSSGFRPVETAQILRLYPCRLRFGDLLSVIIKGDHVGAAFFQRARSQKTGTTEA